MANDEVTRNGWTAVPLNAAEIFVNGPYINKPSPILVADIEFPSQDPVVADIQRFAREHLPRQTYHHSMRVFYWGTHCLKLMSMLEMIDQRCIATAILKQQFPEQFGQLSPSTLALTCLLHDIGTAAENLSATRMSFEFYGAIKALQALESAGSQKDQAEAVAETIIRHQDLGVDGTITFLGQIIQLATIFDNVSDYPTIKNFDQIIHEATLENVNKAFPREGWLGCFADTIREEERLKPWCHSTHIVDFDKKIEGNKFMAQYE